MTAQLAHEEHKPRLGPVTVENWLAKDAPADGSRLELLLGYLTMAPPPMSGHQRVSYRIARAIDDALAAGGQPDLEMLQAVGVRISTPFRTALIPDLVVAKVRESVAAFEPADVLLAVEVWSPGNSRGEREIKMAAYAEAGIPYLWLVGIPHDKPASFRGYRLKATKYVRVVQAEGGETVTAPGPVPVKIDTSALH
jgi:Uma2 family endonuclease